MARVKVEVVEPKRLPLKSRLPHGSLRDQLGTAGRAVPVTRELQPFGIIGPLMPTISEVLERENGSVKADGLPHHFYELIEFAREMFSAFTRPTVISGPPGYYPMQLSPPPKFAYFDIVNKWDVNAFTVKADEKPIVMFRAGAPYAVHEMMNALLSSPNILRDFNGSAERLCSRSEFPDDFSNYERLLLQRNRHTSDSSSRIPLPFTSHLRLIPVDADRRHLAYKLYSNALFFLFFHECAHIERGHLEFISSRGIASAAAEFYAAADSNAIDGRHPILTAFEVEADFHAISHILKSALQETCDPQQIRFGDRPLTTSDSIRHTLLSIGGLFTLFEHVNSKRCVDSNAHFNLRERFLNLIVSVRGLCKIRKYSHHDITEGISGAFSDLAIAADLMGVPALFADLSRDTISRMHAIGRHWKTLRDFEAELEQCREVVSSQCYLYNAKVTQEEYYASAEGEDPYSLTRQTVHRGGKTGVSGFSYTWRVPKGDDAEEYYERGLGWARNDHNAKAIADFTAAIKLDGEHFRAYCNRGVLHLRNGDHASALTDFSNMIRIAPEHAATCLKEGIAWVRGAGASAAASDLTSQVRLDPDRSQLHLARADLSVKDQWYDGIEFALEEYEEAIRLDVDNVNAYISRASLNADLGNWERSLDDLTRALRQCPDSQIARAMRASALAELNRFADADAEFAHVLKLQPDDQYALKQYAISLCRRGRHRDAIPFMERALRTDPDAPLLLLYCAEVHRGAGNRATAEVYISAAKNADPHSPDPHIAHANLWLHFDELANALHELDLAVQLGTTKPAVYALRGRVNTALGYYDEAISDFDRAIEADDRNVEYYLERGESSLRKGNAEQAYNDASFAIQEVDSVEGRILRAKASAKRRDYNAAERDLAAAVQIDGANAQIFLERSRVRIAASDFIGAIEDCTKAISCNTECVEAYLRRASILLSRADVSDETQRAATEDATRACQLTARQKVLPLVTLARAYAIGSDFNRAIRCQLSAVLLGNAKQKPILLSQLKSLREGKVFQLGM